MMRTLRNLLFSALTAAALLGGAELLLRALNWPDPGLYGGDPASLWWLRPDLPPREVPFPERESRFTVRTNSLGYRGDEPPPGALMALGDSTTFGWGVAEEQAWPARLAEALGRPVVNAGVPGYTTVQTLARLDHALSAKPSGLILACLVRDADPANVPDALRPPSRAPDLRLLAAMRQLKSRGQKQGPPSGSGFRVPPEDYLIHLREIISRARAQGVQVWVLAFPMLKPPEQHLAALAQLTEAPVLQPTLPPDSFFAEDPIHLTPEGHQRLAEQLAESLR